MKAPTEDPLVPLGKEARDLNDYCGEDIVRQGAALGQVLRRHPYAEPVSLNYISGLRPRPGRTDGFVAPYVSVKTQLCRPEVVGDGYPAGPSASWPSGAPEFGVMLPDCIVERILKNEWHELLFLQACPILDRVLPAAEGETIAAPTHPLRDNPGLQVSVDIFEDLLWKVQRRAPIILDALASRGEDYEDIQTERAELIETAEWAWGCSRVLGGQMKMS